MPTTIAPILTVAGRPLSNPHTHLHTCSPGREIPECSISGLIMACSQVQMAGIPGPSLHGALNNYMVTAIAVSPSNPNALALIVIPTSGLGQQSGIAISR